MAKVSDPLDLAVEVADQLWICPPPELEEAITALLETIGEGVGEYVDPEHFLDGSACDGNTRLAYLLSDLRTALGCAILTGAEAMMARIEADH